MSVLSEVEEFVRRLTEIAKIVPPEKLAVVVLGCIAFGAAAGWYARKFLRGKGKYALDIDDCFVYLYHR